jgi:hypothetical protein
MLKSLENKILILNIHPMSFIIIIIIIAIIIYLISYNNRDRDFDYKISNNYQNLTNEQKLLIDITQGLEITIKNNILKTLKDEKLKKAAIKHIIGDREVTFYMNIESLAKQHQTSHNAVFDAVFLACNNVRAKYGIEPEVIATNK